MKPFTIYLACLLFYAGAQATPEPLPTAGNAARETKIANAGAVKFLFSNAGSTYHSDSVLIIFDKYNRTGAGIVYKVFATDSTHSITIPEIPAGKYYVTIKFLGLHRDRLEKLVTIKAKKHEKVHITLQEAELFSKDKVVIPAFRPAFSDMAILRSK